MGLIRNYPDICFMAATYFKIDACGSVNPCCAAGTDLIMGNVKQSSFEEIWNNKAYRKLRKSMFNGRPPVICLNCPQWKLGSADSPR